MDVCRRKKQKVSSVSSLFLVLHCTTMKSAFLSVWLSLFRNSKVTVYSLIYVTLWHMSICAGVVVAIAFQQVDNTPNTETGTQSDNEGLQDFDCAIKKFHGDLLLKIKSLRPVGYTPEIVDFDKLPTAAGADLPVYPGPGVNKKSSRDGRIAVLFS